MNIAPLLTEAETALLDEAFGRAAELYERAEAQSGGLSPLPRLGMARVALRLGRPDDADALLQTVERDFPRCAQTYTLLGVVAEARGELDGARALHAKALALEPALALAHTNLGRLAMRDEKWEHAVAHFQLALQHGASSPGAGVNFGQALFRAGRVSEARRVLGHVVEGNPRHLGALLALTDVLLQTGQAEVTARLLDNALHRFPDEPLVAERRARVAVQRRELDLARAEAWRVTSLTPHEPEAWLFAATVEQHAADYASARRALSQALQLSPRHARALYQLGVVAELEGRRDEARAHYREAAAADPHAWQPLNNLATSLLEEGTPPALREARALLLRALALNATPDLEAARYNLALTCLKLGDKAGARAAAVELLKRTPEHPFASQARRVLKLAA